MTLLPTADLLARARHEARLSQNELAIRAHTSRPTLSAYEHGRTSPTMETAAPLLAASGQPLTAVPLPLHLNWSQPNRQFKLSDRDQRARIYEIVLREGTPADVLTYIDGALLVDLWDNLVLPRHVRAAWSDVVSSTLEGVAQPAPRKRQTTAQAGLDAN